MITSNDYFRYPLFIDLTLISFYRVKSCQTGSRKLQRHPSRRRRGQLHQGVQSQVCPKPHQRGERQPPRRRLLPHRVLRPGLRRGQTRSQIPPGLFALSLASRHSYFLPRHPGLGDLLDLCDQHERHGLVVFHRHPRGLPRLSGSTGEHVPLFGLDCPSSEQDDGRGAR